MPKRRASQPAITDYMPRVKRQKRTKKTSRRGRQKSRRGRVIGGNQTGGSALGGNVTLKLTQISKSKWNKKYNIYKYISNNGLFLQNGTFACTTANSLQGVVSFQALNATSDLKLAFTNQAQFKNFTTGTVIQQALDAAGYKCNKWGLNESKITMNWSNASPASIYAQIYYLTSKVTKPTLVAPEVDWTTGLTDEIGNNLQVGDKTRLGASPTNSKLFNMNWKIRGVHRLHLQSGEQATTEYKQKLNKLIDTEYINTYNQIAGLTVYVMAIVRGQTGDNAHTRVEGAISITAAKLLMTYDRKYSTQLIEAWPKTVSYDTTIPAQTAAYIQDATSGTDLDGNLDANFA